ncbi:unnamed protein product [Heterobilharzia americana]|nr:unnamed protein product [Heterobilharzia americana]
MVNGVILLSSICILGLGLSLQPTEGGPKSSDGLLIVHSKNNVTIAPDFKKTVSMVTKLVEEIRKNHTVSTQEVKAKPKTRKVNKEKMTVKKLRKGKHMVTKRYPTPQPRPPVYFYNPQLNFENLTFTNIIHFIVQKRYGYSTT